jgi:NADH-quinone oxidoreductase subunit A
MTPLVAYVLLFVAVGFGFILVHLLAGKLIRPIRPDAEKGTIYECGEPTIGSAWVQFDLRFYVVALLFVIFDVEVAFFFPWAEVFGKANALSRSDLPPAERAQATRQLSPAYARGEAVRDKLRDLRTRLNAGEPITEDIVESEVREVEPGFEIPREANVPLAQRLEERQQRVERDLAAATDPGRESSWAWGLSSLAFVEIVVFFGVLLVGFAYLWRRGDLHWVRALEERRAGTVPPPPVPPVVAGREPAQAGSAS